MEKIDAIERLKALLTVMDATQGEGSEYSRDVQCGIDRIKELEAKREVKFIQGRADQMVYDAELVEEYRVRAEKTEKRIKELDEGIRKWHMSPRRSISDFDRADKELYKLLGGK